MIKWVWRQFNDLSVRELYDILALRESIFVHEQQCYYIDLDYKDHASWHLFGLEQNTIQAYLRLLPKGVAYPHATSVGRVLIKKESRGKGWGKQIIIEALRFLVDIKNSDPIVISAQLYLKDFYRSFGFKEIGEPYSDAGILHVPMQKDVE